MLRATHSALKSGGRLGFYVIAAAEGIDETGRELLARRDGNDHVEAPSPYGTLLSHAGFGDIEVIDVTEDFAETVRAWKEAWEAEAPSLIEVFGEAEFARKIENRSYDIAHIEQGLLRRFGVFGVKV